MASSPPASVLASCNGPRFERIETPLNIRQLEVLVRRGTYPRLLAHPLQADIRKTDMDIKAEEAIVPDESLVRPLKVGVGILRLGRELDHGLGNAEEVVAKGAHLGHAGADREGQLQAVLKVIAKHGRGLLPELRDGVVGLGGAVEKDHPDLADSWVRADGDGIEERRGGGGGAAGLPDLSALVDVVKGGTATDVVGEDVDVGRFELGRANEPTQGLGRQLLDEGTGTPHNLHLAHALALARRVSQQATFVPSFGNNFLDRPLQLRCAEPRPDVGPEGEGVPVEDGTALGKDTAHHFHIDFYAFLDGHLQPAQHDGNQPAGAGAPDHVEPVAWLGRVAGVDGDLLHELLEDVERRQAPHAAAVEAEELECAWDIGTF